MSSEEMAARIEQARNSTPAEAAERQRLERRARAEPIGLPEPRPFVAGDRVVVNGTSWLNSVVRDFVGIVETVPERLQKTVERSTYRDGYTVRVREEDGAGRTMYFRPEAVEHYDMVED